MDRNVFMTFEDLVKINTELLEKTHLMLYRSESYEQPFVRVECIDASAWKDSGLRALALLIGDSTDESRIIGPRQADVMRAARVEFVNVRYSMMNERGEIVPDPGSQQVVIRKLTALRWFFAHNDLLKVEMFDAKGNLIDRDYRKNDFTEEGIELLRRKEGAWLKSKASAKDPPDMELLEKALAEIRTGKESH